MREVEQTLSVDANIVILPRPDMVLTVQYRRRILEALGNEDRKCSELATMTGIGLQAVQYHLMALRQLGRVAIVGLKRNPGKRGPGRPGRLWRRVDA